MLIKLNHLKQTIKQRRQKKRCSFAVAAGLILMGILPLFGLLLTACGVQGTTSQAHYASSRRQDLIVSPSATATVHNATQIATQVDSLLKEQLAQQQFTGTVLVALGSQVLLAKGYGLADDTNQIPNTPETRFFLGSITKQFTATAILLLQQQGKLHVQDPLCTSLPNCPDPWQGITIKEVLTHTSGIPQPDDSQLSDDSPQAWIDSFDDLPLEFTPGTQYDYCSICYQILAYVVQQVSGEPYTQYVQQMILDPLKMTHSSFDPNAYYSQAGGAIGYASWQVPAEQLGISQDDQWAFLGGSGLLYSSANDLFRWDQALYTNALLPQAVLATAITPYVDAAELYPGSDYGYGWFITQSPVEGHRLIWHDGQIDGFRNYIGRYVDDHVTILVLSNLASLDPVAFEQSIQKVVFANL